MKWKRLEIELSVNMLHCPIKFLMDDDHVLVLLQFHNTTKKYEMRGLKEHYCHPTADVSKVLIHRFPIRFVFLDST